MSKYFEVLLIKLAAWILMGRNLGRCKVVSRKDNNAMWYMAENLDAICARMLDGYNGTEDDSNE